MTPTRPLPVPAQARELREVLEALAEALGRGDESAVLTLEPVLQAVLASSGTAGSLTTDERTASAVDLQRARKALARCRAIGAAATELAGVTLDVVGGGGSYGRHGAGQPRAPRGRSLHARV